MCAKNRVNIFGSFLDIRQNGGLVFLAHPVQCYNKTKSTPVLPAVSRCDVLVMYGLLMQELQRECDLDG